MAEIKNIEYGVEWPGSLSNAGAQKWEELWRALDKLYVGGPALVAAFDDEKELASAQSSVAYYGNRQNCRDAGWLYKTTRRSNSLFVVKAAIPKSRR